MDPAAARAEPLALEAPVVVARAGLSFADAAMLGLIALLVVIVSLPRLRRFALRENEIDAIRMLRVLGKDAAQAPSIAPTDLAGLLSSSSGRRSRLEDVEVLSSRRLRRHGYLFEAVEPEPGRVLILAWPWEHGRTGLAAFAIAPGGEPLGMINRDGRYSGPAHPPVAADTAAWRALGDL